MNISMLKSVSLENLVLNSRLFQLVLLSKFQKSSIWRLKSSDLTKMKFNLFFKSLLACILVASLGAQAQL